MKKTIGSLCLFFLSHIVVGQINSKLVPYAEDVFYSTENKLNFVSLKSDHSVTQAEVPGFINSIVFNDGINTVSLQKTERDELGFTHLKFSVLQNGVLLANKVIMAHCSNGKLITLNGDLYNAPAAENSFSISEKKALAFALAKVHAKKYKWENKAEELHMREALNEPGFSYYPDGVKVVFEKNGRFYNAYQFNIYAEEPLYRANVFVDAADGKVLEEQNLICTADVPATATTKYSGSQSFTVDYTGSYYRLRETQRGNGIETYNMHNGSNYLAASDFTNSTSNWTTTGVDQAATDAHWGAEETYDYYLTQHNRNSINNNGFKLLSYVHYQTNYTNAFWDGQRMTYGDGNGGSYKIFTALDVCGHEITHGLTSNTGNLTYSNESGALNESYSDIFGTSIENYGRPGNWNWKIGEDLTNGNGLRSMSNPNAYGDPDTYGGTNYYTGTADNGGVHTNSGVSNYWFYLLTMGGSGTNDLSNAYSVSGLGITNAAKIAFRALTVYFTPSTNYANARLLTIQAAKDLFGNCSNEVIQTTRAWYAVGVGANYIAGSVGPNFTSNVTNFCSAPASVSFTNTTANGLSYTWDFGDGSSIATSTNALHTYTAVGIYAVKLKAVGCASALDSITKNAFVVINPPVSSPVVSGNTVCENDVAILNGSGSATIKWYDNPTGGTELGSGNIFTTPSLTATTTYYAANTITLAPVFGGIAAGTSGGGYQNINTNYIIFDVLQNSVLNSVVVYCQTPGTKIIQMRSSTNVVLYTTTISISTGSNVVTLNYYLTPGTNYRLGLSTTSGTGLYRTTTGVAYPYNVGGCVNMTSSSQGSGAYYYFYNWKISKPECASARIPVVASMNPLPVLSLNTPADPVCMDDVINIQGTPVGGSYMGSNMSGSLFNASTSGPGTYTVSYMYTDANTCTNTLDATLIVTECTGILKTGGSDNSVLIYPNPAKENLVVSNSPGNGKITASDASGRIVLMKDLTSSEQKIELTGLSSGMYIINIMDGSAKTIKTMKLVKE